MDRPLRHIAIATALVIALAVVAASSASVRVWEVSPSTDSSSSGPVDTHDPTERPDPNQPSDGAGSWPTWVGTVLQLLVVPVVLLAASTIGSLRGPHLRRRRRGASDRREFEGDALPRPVTVDIDAARTALLGAIPNDAIIACWMQLERDASSAGVPRWAHETAAEFATRVISEASVDPAPIAALAALYREARFSRHHLDHDDRARALDALAHVERSLRHRAKVAS